jgi:hypothetical protein
VWEHPHIVVRALSNICALKAGHVAEWRATRKADFDGARSDRRNAIKWLWALAPEDARQELRALDQWLELRTKRLVTTHWSAIEAVARALLERRSLSGREVRDAVRGMGVLRDPRPTRAERDEARRLIAFWIQHQSPEETAARLKILPPGERRMWQRVQREMGVDVTYRPAPPAAESPRAATPIRRGSI